MKLILILFAAGVGYHLLTGGGSGQQPTSANDTFSQITSIASGLINAGNRTASDSAALRRAIEPVASDAGKILTQATQGTGLVMPAAAPGCGEPDEHGNLKYCFNK